MTSALLNVAERNKLTVVDFIFPDWWAIPTLLTTSPSTVECKWDVPAAGLGWARALGRSPCALGQSFLILQSGSSSWSVCSCWLQLIQISLVSECPLKFPDWVPQALLSGDRFTKVTHVWEGVGGLFPAADQYMFVTLASVSGAIVLKWIIDDIFIKWNRVGWLLTKLEISDLILKTNHWGWSFH